MVHQRTGERVLRVCINVHFHNTVGQCLPDFFQRRARPAVKHQIKFRRPSVPLHHRILTMLENLRTQLDRPRLVRAMHIAKGRRKHIPPQPLQRLIHFHHVLRRRVQLLRSHPGRIMAILLPTDHARFYFQNNLQIRTLPEQRRTQLHVLS